VTDLRYSLLFILGALLIAGLGIPESGPLKTVASSGAFVSPFVGRDVLFRKAARAGRSVHQCGIASCYCRRKASAAVER
jgi:hypothetical protein